MVRIVTFGEPLLIIRTRSNSLLEQARIFEVLVAGSELNFAIGLSRLGMNSAWIGKIVSDPFGRRVVSTLRQFGVDVSHVVWTPTGRIGIAFMELGIPPRSTKVLYYREGSAASKLKTTDIDWGFMRSAKLIHTSGITPALSEDCKRVVFEAFDEAKKTGAITSFDVNYRSRLWGPDQAREMVETIAMKTDILITSLHDAKILWGIDSGPEQTVKLLKRKFKNDVIVVTIGEMGSIAYSDKIFRGKAYDVKKVNRMGAGDSFDAGFIYGYLKEDVQTGLDYGGAMAALKLTILEENFPIMSKEEVERLIIEGPSDVLR